jgi:xylulokinase
LVRADGSILHSEATPHATRFGPNGQADQAPDDWWAGMCRNTRALAERHPQCRSRLAAIGVSGHMLGCLPVDAEGRALHPCLIHSDCRAAREAEHIAAQVGVEALYRVTGNVLDPRSPLCKMLWLKHHEPGVYARTVRFLQSKDFITGRLIGRHDSTDLSDASHAQWLDLRTRAYAADLLAGLGLDPGRLPTLYRGTDVVGHLCRAAATALGLPTGIPVVAGGGDGACATVGAGAVRAGDTYCCIGTTAWIAATVAAPIFDPQRRTFQVVAVDGQTCAAYGTVQAAGRSLDWAMDLLQEPSFARLDALLASAPPGCGGLVFLPYLEGERSPIWDANARGVFFGISPDHGRAHVLRAVVEGVSLGLRSVLEVLREHTPIPALRLIGGGGQSTFWQQLLADVARVEVQTLSVQAADATSLGAAIAAGVGVGLFPSVAAACRAIVPTRMHMPDPLRSALYDRQFTLYASLYPALRTAFAALPLLRGTPTALPR